MSLKDSFPLVALGLIKIYLLSCPHVPNSSMISSMEEEANYDEELNYGEEEEEGDAELAAMQRRFGELEGEGGRLAQKELSLGQQISAVEATVDENSM